MHKQIVRRQAQTHLPQLAHTPLLQQIYQNRGIETEHQLTLSLSELSDYKQLKGINEAVKLLAWAWKEQKRLLIVGDFDTDGATSTALCMHLLKDFGFNDLSYMVPNRFEFGYGLSKEIVQTLQADPPDLIMTVDNGISSFEGVALAQQFGCKVLITDHHLAGDHLPDADAIVNPNQPGCHFVNKSACGCAVAFYVMAALRAHMVDQGLIAKQQAPNIANRLDLVALATIADVVPLTHDNRILVQQGLNRIRQGRCLTGIKALIKVAKRQLLQLSVKILALLLHPD